jgi:adenylate cyclase
MGEDQERTIADMREMRHHLFEPVMTGNGGKIVKRTGDGWIVEFPNVSSAVTSAMAAQRKLFDHDTIRLRIGVHIGDVTWMEDELYGDGINIAARLETLVKPGQVLISDTVHDSLDRKTAKLFFDPEQVELKNIPRPVMVRRWAVAESRNPEPISNGRGQSTKPSIAVLPFEIMSGDSEQTYFSDGITDDIITDLGRYADLFVIARHSSFLSGRGRFRGQNRLRTGCSIYHRRQCPTGGKPHPRYGTPD